MMDDTPQDAPDQAPAGEQEVTLHFLRLTKNYMGRAARAKRLRENDVLVAINGELFTGDSNDLGAIFSMDQDEDSDDHRRWLLTFWRNGAFFHQVYGGALVAHFEYETGDKAHEIRDAFGKLTYAPLDTYENHEIFRAQDDRAALHSLKPDELATIVPLLWMLNHGLFYPMLAISIIYALTFLTSLLLFIPTYVLVSIYTKKAQLDLLRSFQLFKDRQYWATIAAPNEIDAQMQAIGIDSEIRFNSTPPPKKKKTAKRAG